MNLKTAAACTLGCKVNQYDTDALLEKLAARGVVIKSFHEAADLYIVNTCTVTHIGDRKSRQMIRRARSQNPHAKVAVCGCLARLEPDMARAAGADFIFDARNPDSLFLTLTEHDASEEPARPVRRTRAHLKIQEGCDRFCAYCIVPYARGPITSRPPAEVLAEAEKLVASGAREIVLTGIHIASYGKDLAKEDPTLATLPGLMLSVGQTSGLSRLRLGSIEPYAADGTFLAAITALPCLCAHFHLSLQSGCDRTLRRMNRRYTTAEYANAAEAIRAALPDAALTTDVIVGFPGECDADFEDSLRFVESIGFLQTHVFEYSPRAGTPAAGFDDQVPAPIKSERSRRMRALAADMTRAFLAGYVGRSLPVLFETEHDGYWEGHTPNYIKVRIKSARSLLNQIIEAKLTKAGDGFLYGEIVSH